MATRPVLAARPIDNSQVVREVDPRSSRDLWALFLLVGTLVGGLALYAWPNLQLKQTAATEARLAGERDRLTEENRKLRLEKATLEDLNRVETIATRELGLTTPPADRVVVVERPAVIAGDSQLAQGDTAVDGSRRQP